MALIISKALTQLLRCKEPLLAQAQPQSENNCYIAFLMHCWGWGGYSELLSWVIIVLCLHGPPPLSPTHNPWDQCHHQGDLRAASIVTHDKSMLPWGKAREASFLKGEQMCSWRACQICFILSLFVEKLCRQHVFLHSNSIGYKPSNILYCRLSSWGYFIQPINLRCANLKLIGFT